MLYFKLKWKISDNAEEKNDSFLSKVLPSLPFKGHIKDYLVKFKIIKLNGETLLIVKNYTNCYNASLVWNTCQNIIECLQKSELKPHENRVAFSYHGLAWCENLSYKSINQPTGMKAQKERLYFVLYRMTLN